MWSPQRVIRTDLTLGEFIEGACDVELVMPAPSGEAIVMLVDYRGRPDVADLGRVHSIEGDGDVVGQWMLLRRPDGSAYWRCELTVRSPVHCEFAIAGKASLELAELLASGCPFWLVDVHTVHLAEQGIISTQPPDRRHALVIAGDPGFWCWVKEQLRRPPPPPRR